MKTIDQYLPEHPFFHGLDAATTDLLAGCAVNATFRSGEFLIREGESADNFYVIRHGRVAIEARTPGPGFIVDTVDDGDVVGWSWVVPPYRWAFDARVVEDTSAVSFDAACLRAKCLTHPLVGYELMIRFVQLMNQRLQSARIRLLDMYGGTHHG
jgi:CRP/FNR family cyclic AMP-dependent transcriptional regulator